MPLGLWSAAIHRRFLAAQETRVAQRERVRQKAEMNFRTPNFGVRRFIAAFSPRKRRAWLNEKGSAKKRK
jgi:hypothetical protein